MSTDIQADSRLINNFVLITERTQIETAILELELVNVEPARAEVSRAALAARLAALGARVPVHSTRERSAQRLRAVLTGPHAVDYIYHIENMVCLGETVSSSSNPYINYLKLHWEAQILKPLKLFSHFYLKLVV